MTPSTSPRADIADRSRAIVDAARRVAETEGWPAVTVRRLADEIGFSQPILYRCFPGGRDEIVEHVMIDGFLEMGAVLADPDGEADSLLNVSDRPAPCCWATPVIAKSAVSYASMCAPFCTSRRGLSGKYA